jgi:hypothetical protein
MRRCLGEGHSVKELHDHLLSIGIEHREAASVRGAQILEERVGHVASGYALILHGESVAVWQRRPLETRRTLPRCVLAPRSFVFSIEVVGRHF